MSVALCVLSLNKWLLKRNCTILQNYNGNEKIPSLSWLIEPCHSNSFVYFDLDNKDFTIRQNVLVSQKSHITKIECGPKFSSHIFWNILLTVSIFINFIVVRSEVELRINVTIYFFLLNLYLHYFIFLLFLYFSPPKVLFSFGNLCWVKKKKKKKIRWENSAEEIWACWLPFLYF